MLFTIVHDVNNAGLHAVLFSDKSLWIYKSANVVYLAVHWYPWLCIIHEHRLTKWWKKKKWIEFMNIISHAVHGWLCWIFFRVDIMTLTVYYSDCPLCARHTIFCLDFTNWILFTDICGCSSIALCYSVLRCFVDCTVTYILGKCKWGEHPTMPKMNRRPPKTGYLLSSDDDNSQKKLL